MSKRNGKMRSAVATAIAEAMPGFDEADEERYNAEAEERLTNEGGPEIAEEGPPAGVPLVPVVARDLGERILENLGEMPTGYKRRHIDLKLDHGAADFVARLFHGLNQADVRLASGKHVATQNDAVRWLLEQCMLATCGS